MQSWQVKRQLHKASNGHSLHDSGTAVSEVQAIWASVHHSLGPDGALATVLTLGPNNPLQLTMGKAMLSAG